jgi:serine/threonine protein kinase
MSAGAVETSGSIGIIIGVVVGMFIAVVLALVFMRRRRRRLNDNEAAKGGQATNADEKAAKRAEAQKAEAERDDILTKFCAEAFMVPPIITEEMAQKRKSYVRSLVPRGTAFDRYYPEVVISYATGRREQDCQGAGPGMYYAAGFISFLHQCGVQCFSGLHVPPGTDWKVFMLRLKGRHAKAEVLIVLKTKSFYESAPCLKELSCAIDQKIPVIPIVLEENLPSPKQQWSKLTDQDSEVMIAKVQEHLGKINDIPSPGTLLTVPITLDEILEEINKHVTTKAQELTTLTTQNFAAKRGGRSRMIPISSKRSQPLRSKPPPLPPPKGSGTEMSSIVGSSMHVVNLVSWKELTLRERLGVGSFGEVRVAVYNSTPCAIKSLRAATTPAALQELISEFELTMRLHHPNVLLTMGIAHANDDGKTGILMELMPASLLDVLHHHRQRDKLATWEASLVLIAFDVAKGMAYLHAKDVVHRDLKPGNVLLTEHWVAKVADFGTALTKYAGQAEGPAGTPSYMAPEAIALTSGAKAKPTDVWSFGCLLAHMGTRSIPYSHVQLPPKDTAHALMAIIVNGQATPLNQLRNVAGCPRGILALTTRCLQTDPGQRPKFLSIVDELQRIKGSVHASRPSALLRRADAIGQAGATTAPTLISATYCAPTDTSATYCASTYTSVTSINPTYTSATYSAPMAPTNSSATLPEGWNSKDSFLSVMANQMPKVFTEQMAQQVTQRIRSQRPAGTAFDEYYPKVVVSHATGRRRDPSVARSAWTAKVGWSDCAGAGPGMFYAAGFLEVLHQCGVQCFSGLHVPAGIDWEVFMLRLKGRHAKAKVLIVLKTKAFYESEPCLKELSCAIDKKIPVIPIVLEENLPDKQDQWKKLTDQDSEVMIAKVQEQLGKINDIPDAGTLLTVPEALDEILEEIHKHVPFMERAVASAAPDPVPALALRYAIGSSVFVKRSHGDKTLAYVKEYDAEMALYTVEIETLGSGKTEKCHEKDLRAANVGLIEGLMGSARAALLTFQAGSSQHHA